MAEWLGGLMAGWPTWAAWVGVVVVAVVGVIGIWIYYSGEKTRY